MNNMNNKTLADILRNLFAIEMTAHIMMVTEQREPNAYKRILELVLRDMAEQLERFENELEKSGIGLKFTMPGED